MDDIGLRRRSSANLKGAAGMGSRRILRFGIRLLAFLAPVVVAAMPIRGDEGKPGEASAEGFWPSPKLLDSVLSRWADEVAAEYSLDDAQRGEIQKELVEPWAKFLGEHREELRPLLNEFIEMRLDLEAPTNERVRGWAKRAAPALARIDERMEQTSAAFRRVLKPDQLKKYSANTMQFPEVMKSLESRLNAWQRGEFREEELWDPPRRVRSERRRRPGPLKASESGNGSALPSTSASPPAEDQIALELDRWEIHVKEFIVRFNLDGGQRTAALSCLSELRERAADHRRTRSPQIDRLEERIRANKGSDAELGEIRTQLVDLYGPIDDLFAELCRRLDSIPTEAQRQQAAGKKSAETDGPP